MKREAELSPCGTYRFSLTRWEEPGIKTLGSVLWVLNNPSIADAEVDDMTVKKCWRYTRGWGFTKMIFVNCNPYRSTDPKLAKLPNRWARGWNDRTVKKLASKADLIICAWGQGAEPELADHMFRLLTVDLGREVCALELCNDGAPKHPLYLKADLQPITWWAE